MLPTFKSYKRITSHYILGAKKGDHSFLFKHVDATEKNGQISQFEYISKEKPDIIHRFRFINQVPLNESNPDLFG